MNIRESAENYLETILILGERKGSVRSIDIANELNFSKPSVSVAMKNLRKNGYITIDEGGFITLTDAGFEIADRMYERHRIISRYFMLLGVDPDTAVKDACRIEHIISASSFEAIKGEYDRLCGKRGEKE
jgi:Mn-dependent transcriptional regulator